MWLSTDFDFQVWLIKKYFASDQHYQLENVKTNETKRNICEEIRNERSKSERKQPQTG